MIINLFTIRKYSLFAWSVYGQMGEMRKIVRPIYRAEKRKD
jgi:hypothetical protein